MFLDARAIASKAAVRDVTRWHPSSYRYYFIIILNSQCSLVYHIAGRRLPRARASKVVKKLRVAQFRS